MNMLTYTIFVKESLKINMLKIKNIVKLFINHCHYTREYRGAAHSICNLKYSVPNKIIIVFHNGSNNGYLFIIKELAEEFEAQFTCLGESTEVQYLEELHDFHNDLPFLPKRMKTEKVEKLAANLHDKNEYVIHVRNLKQALNDRLVFKKSTQSY